ncbi:putative pyridine nucleotide-disulfide oxidoreductase [Daedaleopsis nitida]|nr:putative pyridine nucleotide-disulfide oxidoreductase [Daedaleopsis nitida]
MAKTVCIVGAGPSGLVAAKHLLHATTVFHVTIYDKQPRLGGLWPVSPSDTKRQIHPLMVTNQSRHTVHFSDLAWEADTPHLPKGWMVGQYLEQYKRRWLSDAEIVLGKEVVRTERAGTGWKVVVSGGGSQEENKFDHLVVASGFFGEPRVDKQIVEGATVPVAHSSAYRDLKSLLGDEPCKGSKLLVVGGQMSGFEIAGTAATHIATVRNTPDAPKVLSKGPESLTVHHLIQRPVWVMPLHLTAQATKSPPFLPLDIPTSNLANRPPPLSDTQGHISEQAALASNAGFEFMLGTNQAEYSPLLGFVDDAVRRNQAFVSVSEHYCNFVRDGKITVQNDRLVSMDGNTAHTNSGTVEDVAAVILATGFGASKGVSFLPSSVLKTLHYDPSYSNLPIALAFHGAYHPDVANLGFVGFYRAPYWGIMEMQARFLAVLWSDGEKPPGFSETVGRDQSIERTLRLRGDPRGSQFPMGDYLFIMTEFSAALDIPISPSPPDPPLPPSPHLDFLCPARYNPDNGKEATRTALDAHTTIYKGITTPLFVARAVFRSLLGTWRLERSLTSKDSQARFSGTAQFLLRERFIADKWTVEEYLHVEEGTLVAADGQSVHETKRYIWRYTEQDDRLSVWFAKPDDPKQVDRLFHQVEFAMPTTTGEESHESVRGWLAHGTHLGSEDYRDIKYEFTFKQINLESWTVAYGVKTAAKDYTIAEEYQR